MINGRIKVRLVKDEKTGFLYFEFPEEEDRALACFRLAEFALEDERNKAYRGDIGYLRNLFLGSAYKRLYRVWFEPDEMMCFCFRSSGGYVIDEETVVLKKKTKEIEFVIEEEEAK